MDHATARPALSGHLPLTGYLCLFCAVALTAFGLVALSSAGRAFSADPYFILKRQTLWLLPAMLACVAAYQFPLELLRRYVWLLALGGFGLLGLVLVPDVGVSVNGARRWLDLGFARLQPSDFAKPLMVLVLAHYLAANQRYARTFFRGYLMPCGLMGLFCGLILLQPDFGTTVLFAAVGFTLLFVVGVRLLYLVPTVIAGLIAFGTLVYYDPVRLRRITSFLDVEANRDDSAYQLFQGMLAFGVGGVDGIGLGQGRQQLSFLPEAHTDFIFPIIGEELGLIATMAVVCLFVLLLLCVVVNLRKAPNLFTFNVALGCILFIAYQCLINIGVVTGLLPTKGMSLPFISYGGSNLVVMFAMIGLILNCFREWEAPPLRGPREL